MEATGLFGVVSGGIFRVGDGVGGIDGSELLIGAWAVPQPTQKQERRRRRDNETGNCDKSPPLGQGAARFPWSIASHRSKISRTSPR